MNKKSEGAATVEEMIKIDKSIFQADTKRKGNIDELMVPIQTLINS